MAKRGIDCGRARSSRSEGKARFQNPSGARANPRSAFTNGKRDAEQDYVSAEVAKLTTAGNVPPELQSFYAAVTKHDQSWTYGCVPDAFDDD